MRASTFASASIRAGVLEAGTARMLAEAKVDARMRSEGLVHHGIELAQRGRRRRIDFADLVGGSVVIFGQSEVTKDLGDRRALVGGETFYDAHDASLHGLDTKRPSVRFRHAGERLALEADFIVGCDGYHGVSRASIPAQALRTFERGYPFAWLGIMADVAPPADELIYAQHDRGFALCSMRSRARSRHYIQVAPDARADDWPDERIWDEIALRIGDEGSLKRAPSIEKSVIPMRSFVCETMRHGRLFLAGDAAHIVPPTGAKGLNLAASDVHYLSEALIGFYRGRGEAGLEAYPARALARVWKAQRFSQWMTALLHNFGPGEAFQDRVHRHELDYVLGSRAAQTSLAENYVGLPY